MLAINNFNGVKIKSMLFKNGMLSSSSSRYIKSPIIDVSSMLLDGYTVCVSCFSDVRLFTITYSRTTLQAIDSTHVLFSTGPIFQLPLERPLPASWPSDHIDIQRPQDSLQGLGDSYSKGTTTVVSHRWSSAFSLSRAHGLLRLQFHSSTRTRRLAII